MKGIIDKVNLEKGFGFIRGSDKRDYFFHRSAIKNGKFEDLDPGVAVTFAESDAAKGPRAEDIYIE